MKTIVHNLKGYLGDTFGAQVEPLPFHGKNSLPLFLHDLYFFHAISLQGKNCILAVAQEADAISPAAIRKHLEYVQKNSGDRCIYVSQAASAYNRKRLVKQGVQFVIPHKQTYLPSLGIDWLDSDRFAQISRTRAKMAPATQAVLLHALIEDKLQFFCLELAKTLKYSAMTMTRVLNELESLKLGRTERRGKERWFRFFTQDRETLWSEIHSLMPSPVKKRVWLENADLKKIKPLGTLAGLSALSEATLLAHPKHPTYAIGTDTWKQMQLDRIEQVPTADEANVELEIWHYDPKLFAKKGVVDYFSLFLSLREHQDERVEKALDELMSKQT